jgi:hypothetical protein
VYLDAYVPKNGESLLDQDAEFASFIKDLVAQKGEGWKIPPFPGSQFLDDAAAIKFFDEHVTACPFAMYSTPVVVDEAHYARAGKGYVAEAQYALFQSLGKKHHDADAWPFVQLKDRHLGCYTNPDATADAILAAEPA